MVASLGLTLSEQQNVLFPETTNISSVISKLVQENVFAPTRVAQSFEPQNCPQPEFYIIPFWAGPSISPKCKPTHTPEPYNSVKQTFDLILYMNLIVRHGVSQLCLQKWNLSISLSDLDSFDLPHLHSTSIDNMAPITSKSTKSAAHDHQVCARIHRSLLKPKWI